MFSPIAGRVIRKNPPCSTWHRSTVKQQHSGWSLPLSILLPLRMFICNQNHKMNVLLEEPHRRQHLKLGTAFHCAQKASGRLPVPLPHPRAVQGPCAAALCILPTLGQTSQQLNSPLKRCRGWAVEEPKSACP